MRTSGWISLGVVLILALGGSCGGKGKSKRKGKGKQATLTQPASPAADPGKGETAPLGQPAPAKAMPLTQGFTRWRPVPAFLSAELYDVSAIGAGHAIVLTDGNQVGVTQDAGASWHFQRLLHGNGLAVHGRAGGPYYVVGKEGYAAFSDQGLEWRDLDRVGDSDLVDVAVTATHATAITKGRQVVSYDLKGALVGVFELPQHQRAGKVWADDRSLYLEVGDAVWSSKDQGRTFQPTTEYAPSPGRRQALTSQGVCGPANTGRHQGLVCTVAGEGFAASAQEVFVVSRDVVQVTRNGGKTWVAATLPFDGVNKIGGQAGGPFVAVGSGGRLAVSDNGVTWRKVDLGATPILRDVWVKGDRALAVGNDGAVFRSTDRGKTWGAVDPGVKKSFTHLAVKGDELVLPTTGSVLVSRDGAAWTEAADKAAYADLPAPPAMRRCAEALPGPGQPCRVQRDVRTPKEYPWVSLLDFRGDFGVIGGHEGLVAVTTDGGVTWKPTEGFKFWGDLRDLAVSGDRVVAVSTQAVFVSGDQGKTWRRADLPKNLGELKSAYVDPDGYAYVSGDQATVVKSGPDLASWTRLDLGAPGWVSIHRVLRAGKALFALAMKGEVYRSEDQGRTWSRVYTGQGHPVVNLVVKGHAIFAVTSTAQGWWWTRYRGDSVLLRSVDGGKHFAVLGVLGMGGTGQDLHVEDDGAIVYENLVSRDDGRTWTRRAEHHFMGVTPVGDGSGRFIGNRRNQGRRDQFYVVDKDMKTYALLEGFYHEDALLRCDPKSGCYMASGQVIYRPF